MATDLEHATSTIYSPLPDSDNGYHPPSSERRRPIALLSGIFLSMLLFSSLIALILNQHNQHDIDHVKSPPAKPVSRGVSHGVSEKSNSQLLSSDVEVYPWTNAMLSWQRTGFHFQPPKNWMNGNICYKIIIKFGIIKGKFTKMTDKFDKIALTFFSQK
ncbi:putative beta-fructofuranosidase [Helianthus annuus]|nr:putative beta-fructofuranosidase [Helianthus annuus]